MTTDTLAFAEKMIALLDEGARNTSYKFAVLTALLDISIELLEESDLRVVSITTDHVAARVLDLYWPQTELYQEKSHLLAGHTGQAEIISRIIAFRASPSGQGRTLRAARLENSAAFQRLHQEIEWKLAEQPLPRLQRFGDRVDPFIYSIGWNESVKRSEFKAPSFDRSIRFRPGAVESFVRLNGLLRPLIQRKWAAFVAAVNDKLVPDSGLEEFLFGADRISLEPMRAPLIELQEGSCFYCSGGIGPRDAHVDHFIPWIRWPSNLAENLVAAHGACNLAKKDFLPALRHVDRWLRRNRDRAGDLRVVSTKASWESDGARVVSAARGIYLSLPSSAELWLDRRHFEAYDPASSRSVFGC